MTLTQEIKRKKRFSNTKPCKFFTNFTILIRSFCLVLRVAPISLFFIFYFISLFTIFTIYYTFHSILSLNDVRDIINFTIYVFQICMSPITKNNFNYSLYFFNTNHILLHQFVNILVAKNWFFFF